MVGKRDGRWWARVYVGGRQKWLGTFETQREARQAERRELDRKPVKGRETCESFATRWPDDYPRSATSARTYRYALKPFIATFGQQRLSDVDRPSARAWALQHRDNARVVRTMFGDALRDGLVADNPFSGLRLEQPRGRRDIVALTYAETERLGEIALETFPEYGPTLRAMILFAADTGVRPGELFVLERDDLDLDANEVHVRRGLDGTGAISTPKNGKQRTVTLPPRAKNALLVAPARLDSPYVFTTSTGKRLSKSSLYYRWTSVTAVFGNPGLDFYELRHHCATELLERGVSHADVAVQLGHTDGGRLVMERYGHPSETAARERLKQAFRPPVELRSVATRSQTGGKSA